MGVLGLWKLLEDGGKPVPLETLENKILAVDISIWLHQTIKGFQDGRGSALPNSHLTGLFIRLCKLLHYRIKPVFVFDGGVPALKRETIKKRATMKSRTHQEANRIEQLLLEGLARESAVQQILGSKVQDMLSPSKARALRSKAENDRFEIFKLPEAKGDETEQDLEETSEEAPEAQEDDLRELYAAHIQDIDVKSSHFKSIPADIRHTILFDMKETRKLSSWGRLHEMPSKSDDFCNFQMKRLLKRRQVQVSLEEAETEMGGKSLTFNELEALMSEEGIIDPVHISKKSKQIASDENTRFLLIKGIHAVKEEAKLEEEKQKTEVIPEEEDYDLQKAIAMSLEEDPCNLTQADVKSTREIRMNTPQRDSLKKFGKASAKAYMQEYGILTSEEISDLFVKKSFEMETEPVKEQDESLEMVKEKDYPDSPLAEPIQVNSQSSVETVIYDPKAEAVEANTESKAETTEDIESVTSSTDSDFVDVPEDNISQTVFNSSIVEQYSLPLGDPENEIKLSDIKPLEVVVNPNGGIDDIFADVFGVEKPKETEVKVETAKNPTDILKQLQEQKTALLKLPSSSIIDLVEDPEYPSVKSTTDFDLEDLMSKEPKVSQVPEKVIEFKELEVTPKKFIPDATKLLRTPTKSSPAKTPQKNVHQTPEKKLEEAILSVPGTSSENLDQIKEKIRNEAAKLKQGPDLEELTNLASKVATSNQLLIMEMNKKDRIGLSITDRMTSECQALLRLFGIPFIVAPMEAEAQCAFLNEIGLIDGIITDDSDVWLFGGKTVYKNFFDKERVVMEFKMETIERLYHIDRSKMIQIALLVGSDYTSGIQGIGTVTALEVLATFSSSSTSAEMDEYLSVLSCLRKFREWVSNGKNSISSETSALKAKLKSVKEIGEGFPNRAVVEAYLRPKVDLSNEAFSWGAPDVEAIKEFAKRHMNWTGKRVDDYLDPVMKRLEDRNLQKSIKNYFTVKSVENHKELAVSKRSKRAIMRLGGEEIPAKETSKAKPKKTKKETKEADGDSDDFVEVETSQKESAPKSRVNKETLKTRTKEKAPASRTKKRAPPKTKADDSETPSGPKVARIPNTNVAIPQRVQDQKEAEERKRKAVEIMKASKKGKQ